jgi:transglutaminase superfamily protein
VKHYWIFIGPLLVVSALAVTVLAALPLSTPAPPDSQTSTDSLPPGQRPLQVAAASEAIVRATVTGPQFYAPEVFAAIEDYHNPRLKRLRQEYGLERVTEGEPEEFRRLLKLRHWVHTRWPIDNEQQEGGDAFSILEKAKTGAGFHCSHSLAVQHAVMVSMGYVARDLGIDRNHEDLGRSMHHGVNEVWSNDYAKVGLA